MWSLPKLPGTAALYVEKREDCLQWRDHTTPPGQCTFTQKVRVETHLLLLRYLVWSYYTSPDIMLSNVLACWPRRDNNPTCFERSVLSPSSHVCVCEIHLHSVCSCCPTEVFGNAHSAWETVSHISKTSLESMRLLFGGGAYNTTDGMRLPSSRTCRPIIKSMCLRRFLKV